MAPAGTRVHPDPQPGSGAWMQDNTLKGPWSFRAKEHAQCIAEGGRNCYHEDPAKQKGGNAIPGLHSSWVGKERLILAMARPWEESLKRKGVVSAFVANNVGMVLNLQESKALSGKMKKTQRLEQMARQQAWPTAKVGEHAGCGPGILRHTGFSYDPETLMAAGVGVTNFSWQDMGVPDLERMMDIVQVMDYVTATERRAVAVHCHAGLGRTGLAIACFFAYSPLIGYSARRCVEVVRQDRPGALQTKHQEMFVYIFEQYLAHLRCLFPPSELPSLSATSVSPRPASLATNSRPGGAAYLGTVYHGNSLTSLTALPPAQPGLQIKESGGIRTETYPSGLVCIRSLTAGSGQRPSNSSGLEADEGPLTAADLGLDHPLPWNNHFDIQPDLYKKAWLPRAPHTYSEALHRQQRALHGNARRAFRHLHRFAKESVFALIAAAQAQAQQQLPATPSPATLPMGQPGSAQGGVLYPPSRASGPVAEGQQETGDEVCAGRSWAEGPDVQRLLLALSVDWWQGTQVPGHMDSPSSFSPAGQEKIRTHLKGGLERGRAAAQAQHQGSYPPPWAAGWGGQVASSWGNRGACNQGSCSRMPYAASLPPATEPNCSGQCCSHEGPLAARDWGRSWPPSPLDLNTWGEDRGPGPVAESAATGQRPQASPFSSPAPTSTFVPDPPVAKAPLRLDSFAAALAACATGRLGEGGDAALAALAAQPVFARFVLSSSGNGGTVAGLAAQLGAVCRSANFGEYGPVKGAPVSVVVAALGGLFKGLTARAPALTERTLAAVRDAYQHLPYDVGPEPEPDQFSAALKLLTQLPAPDQELLLLFSALLRHTARASRPGCEEHLRVLAGWLVGLLMGPCLAEPGAGGLPAPWRHCEESLTSFLWYLMRNDVAFASLILAKKYRLDRRMGMEVSMTETTSPNNKTRGLPVNSLPSWPRQSYSVVQRVSDTDVPAEPIIEGLPVPHTMLPSSPGAPLYQGSVPPPPPQAPPPPPPLGMPPPQALSPAPPGPGVLLRPSPSVRLPPMTRKSFTGANSAAFVGSSLADSPVGPGVGPPPLQQGQQSVGKPRMARALGLEDSGLDSRLYGSPDGLPPLNQGVNGSLKALLGGYPTAVIPQTALGLTTEVHDVWV